MGTNEILPIHNNIAQVLTREPGESGLWFKSRITLLRVKIPILSFCHKYWVQTKTLSVKIPGAIERIRTFIVGPSFSRLLEVRENMGI